MFHGVAFVLMPQSGAILAEPGAVREGNLVQAGRVGALLATAQIMVSIRQYWASPAVLARLASAPECWPPDLIGCCASSVNCLNYGRVSTIGHLTKAVPMPCSD